jgi:hypothetical protein
MEDLTRRVKGLKNGKQEQEMADVNSPRDQSAGLTFHHVMSASISSHRIRAMEIPTVLCVFR